MVRNKRHHKRKKKYKAFFEGEKGIFIIEKLTCDIIEQCKLPEALKLRKKKSRRKINSRKNNKNFL